MVDIKNGVCIKPFSMLKAGGNADQFSIARTVDELLDLAKLAREDQPLNFLGFGSNILVSDKGLRGLTIVNRCKRIQYMGGGQWEVDCGVWFQDLALAVAQSGFEGLEFAVGIPGSVGGALVSNAGAYRSSIGNVLASIRIIDHEGDRWVDPSYLQLTYRDSLLRRNPDSHLLLLTARLQLKAGSSQIIYNRMKDFQRQRIRKQPAPASAGSFFKNVNDGDFANGLKGLPEPLRQSGVVPAGFLIEAAGLRGHRLRRASIGVKHANFILNDRGASASEIRQLADSVRARVHDQFGVWLEEEVLYLGDWSDYRQSSPIH